MNPILLYPQNASQAKFFQETAEKKGIEMLHIPKEMLEDIDDMFFVAKAQELHKSPAGTETVSRERIMEIINSK